MSKWTLARTLWPSPHSLAWQWHVEVQAELKLRLLERALQRRAFPDTVRCIQGYLHSALNSAVSVARYALPPIERHNCCVMLRWSVPWHCARDDLELACAEDSITGVGLRLSWEEYDHPRLVLWHQGSSLGYVEDAGRGEAPISWWRAVRTEFV